MAETRWRLLPAAEDDLSEIWRYGAQEWGPDQADRYADGLFAVFDLLAEFPEMARLHSTFDPPVRLHPTRAHLVIYREAAPGIEVIRILHGARRLVGAIDDL